MKKIFVMLALILLVVSVVPFASAEDTVMDTSPGRTYRLIQLQKALDYTVQGEEIVLRFIEDMGKSADGAADVLAQTQALLDEAKQKNVDDEDFATWFEQTKEEANALIAQFKGITQPVLSEFDDLSKVKDSLKTTRQDVHDYYKDMLANARADVNRGKTLMFLERIGYDDPALMQQLQNGEISAKDAIKQAREHFRTMTKQEKQEMRDNARAENNGNGGSKK